MDYDAERRAAIYDAIDTAPVSAVRRDSLTGMPPPPATMQTSIDADAAMGATDARCFSDAAPSHALIRPCLFMALFQDEA